MAEPPMPATTRPSGESQRLQAGRLDLPQRVAQVLGNGEDVGRAGRSDRPGRSSRGRARAARCWTRSASPSSERDGAFGQVRLREDSHAARQDVARPDRHALAEHGAAARSSEPSPMRTPAATMQSRSTQSAPISAPLRTTERSIVVPSPHRHALAEHDERADVRARRDRAAALDERRRHDAARRTRTRSPTAR